MGDQGLAGPGEVAGGGEADGELGVFFEPAGQAGGEGLVDVLDDHEGGGQVGGQVFEDGLENAVGPPVEAPMRTRLLAVADGGTAGWRRLSERECASL